VCSFPARDDAPKVLSAVRLGWAVAEARGRNRPSAPPGGAAPLPAGRDHALPLRVERSATELRIEAQALLAALAGELNVDKGPAGRSFGTEFDEKAKLLARARADAATRALADAADRLQQTGAASDPAAAGRDAVQILAGAQARQRPVSTALAAAAAAARQAHGQGGSDRTVQAAETALELAVAASAGTDTGLRALAGCITQVPAAAGPAAAAQICHSAIDWIASSVAPGVRTAWSDLAELIWEFDAHVQDRLTATSENVAMGYQLGRGLAETYWALDPDALAGVTSWGFLLGIDRCAELSRLAGRLGAYMSEYTAPAIAASIAIWQYVAGNDGWRTGAADPALYHQIRRWYELIVVGQDPTTLIRPSDVFRDYRTVLRTAGWFLPELLALAGGLAALGFLIHFLGESGNVALKTLTSVLTALGLSVAGISTRLKNSEQALLKRVRQDAYTDLIAYAVQTAPDALTKRDIRTALRKRRLTPATPN
jgi:hypothetical protein